MNPPPNLPDCRTPEMIAHDSNFADQFATKGTVQHFAFRLGFMPNDEKDAEAIITRCIREMEWYSCRSE